MEIVSERLRLIARAAREAVCKRRKDERTFKAWFIQGATFADEHPNWISVDNSLPEDISLALVYDKYGNYHCARYSALSGEWISNTKDHAAIIGVEYWMFVPQPPHTGAKPKF
jgi:hypothetical protein